MASMAFCKRLPGRVPSGNPWLGNPNTDPNWRFIANIDGGDPQSHDRRVAMFL
jgi:hypothetical protein